VQFTTGADGILAPDRNTAAGLPPCRVPPSVVGMLTVYTYKSCDTCRQAVKWLSLHAIPFEEKPIRETPPSVAELRTMLGHLGGERRRLCNTSGKDYREQKLGEILDTLSETDFLARLAANGNLVKRPFLLRSTPPLGLAGFSASAWAAAL
jgi:arsenate reductase (glutaredoxin)